MPRGWLVVMFAYGCGRVGFDAQSGDALGGGSDGPALPLCATIVPAPYLCDDFDQGQGLANWATNLSGGTLTVVPAGTSQPNALRAVSNALATSIDELGLSAGINVGPASRVVVTFSMSFEVLAQGDPVVVQIVFDDGAQDHGIEYAARASGPFIEEYRVSHTTGTPEYFFTNLAPVSTTGWHRFMLDVSTGASARFAFAMDGVTLAAAPLSVTTGGAAFALIGVPYLRGPSSPWQILFDDVVVEVTP